MSKSKVQKYAPLIAAVGAAALGGIAGNYIFNNFEDDEKNAASVSYDDKKDSVNLQEQTASEDIYPMKEFESGEKTSRAPFAGIGAAPPTTPLPPLPKLPPVSTGELTDENSVPSKLPKTPLPSRDTEKNQLYVMTPDGAIQPYLPLEENIATDKEVRGGKTLFIKRDPEK